MASITRRCLIRFICATSSVPRRLGTLAWLVLAGVLPAGAAGTAQPVSPGGRSAGAVAEARCPTFSWAGVEGAAGYELAVFRIAQPGMEPVLVTRTSLPRNAESWTPTSGQCLERGQRYAWSVAAASTEREAEGELEWAPALLFEVEAAPSAGELEQAIATIRRHLATGETSRIADPDARRVIAAATDETRQVEARAPRGVLPAALTSPTTAIRSVSAATTPTFANTGSLSVANQIHLGASSALFKAGAVFQWDDTYGNTSLGRNALAEVSGTAVSNTAFGREALENTTGGAVFEGSNNTAVGDRALRSNTIGRNNTAIGSYALHDSPDGISNTATGLSALRSNTDGFFNTAMGANAMRNTTEGNRNTAIGSNSFQLNTTGERNVAVGYRAGFNSTGSSNILLNNDGGAVAAESNVLRIGQASGTGNTQLNQAFIHGIRGRTTGVADAIAVLIDSAGQLGTVSSSRSLKQDIQDLGPLADRLLELRPVAFRFKQHVATDPDSPLEFGLIAEEVAEAFPELVVYDEEGRPQTVKYHLLSSLLLGELQRQNEVVEAQRLELEQVGARLEALETGAERLTPRPGSGMQEPGSR